MILYPVILYPVFYDACLTEYIFSIADTIEWNLTIVYPNYSLKNNDRLYDNEAHGL